MKLTMTHVDVWVTEIDDRAGGLARTLRAIADYGADLDYVQAHRDTNKADKGVLFVSSGSNRAQLDAVTDMGLRRVSTSMLKVEGGNELGAGSKLAKTIADAGVNMKAFTAGVHGHRFVCYVEFDSALDCQKAETALKALNTHPGWAFWHRHSDRAA